MKTRRNRYKNRWSEEDILGILMLTLVAFSMSIFAYLCWQDYLMGICRKVPNHYQCRENPSGKSSDTKVQVNPKFEVLGVTESKYPFRNFVVCDGEVEVGLIRCLDEKVQKVVEVLVF